MPPENQPVSFPTAIATLPSNPDQWQMATSQQAVAETICDALEQKNPEAVLQELIDQRSIPPEVLALIRDGLINVFQRMRTLMRSKREAPSLGDSLRIEAVRLLFNYFSEVRGTIQKLLSINADVMQHLSLLGTIMSTKELSDFSDSDLQDGLTSIETIHQTQARILVELTRRWMTEVCDENDEYERAVKVHSLVCAGGKDRTVMSIPYGRLGQDQMATLMKAAKAKFTLPGFEVDFFDARECKPHAGEAHFQSQGTLEITFLRL